MTTRHLDDSFDDFAENRGWQNMPPEAVAELRLAFHVGALAYAYALFAHCGAEPITGKSAIYKQLDRELFAFAESLETEAPAHVC